MEKTQPAANRRLTGYPSVDRPWLKYYREADFPVPGGTVFDYMYEKNRGFPDDTAITYFDKTISYGELFRRIDRTAAALSALGVGKGDFVTVRSLNLPRVVYLFYAAGRIGAVLNLIYVTVDTKEVRETVRRTKSKALFIMDRLYGRYEEALKSPGGGGIKAEVLLSAGASSSGVPSGGGRDGVEVMSWDGFLEKADRTAPDLVHDRKAPVVMVYTGGTSGKSKGALLTNENLNFVAARYERAGMGFQRGFSFLNTLPPFIAFGLSTRTHVPLSLGINMILVPDSTPGKTGEYFARYRPNCFVSGALQLESIISDREIACQDLSYVKILAAGGDVIPVPLEKRANEFLKAHNCDKRVVVGYGMTETAATVCTSSPYNGREGSVGTPLPGVVAKIVDEDDGSELSYGMTGEIFISSPSAMSGYFGVRENIVTTDSDGRKWVHTGDLGYIDKDGFLYVVGRRKRMITVVRGRVYHKIYPRTLENMFMRLEGVRECAVVGRPSPRGHNDVVAFVVSGSGRVNAGFLRKARSEKLQRWECPDEYAFIERLPRTRVGKVDFRTLEKIAKDI